MEIAPDEVVVFYPSPAYQEADGDWTVVIEGSIFEPEDDSRSRAAVVRLVERALRVDSPSPKSKILDERIRLFLVDHQRGKTISIHVGESFETLERSGGDGIFSGRFRLSDFEARRLAARESRGGDWITFQAVTRAGDQRRFEGRFQLIPRTGVSIVSDIDDTIKETQVGSREAMLANTFLRPFRPIAGMADLYRRAADRGAVFHYVSACPWQLYPPLADFLRKERFPAGTFHLRRFRMKRLAALDLFGSPKAGKLRAIEGLFQALPDRRFLLIGDSGQQDPELYGELARSHADRVLGVLIRKVSEERELGERLRVAFRNVPDDRWRVFSDPAQIEQMLLERIAASAGSSHR